MISKRLKKLLLAAVILVAVLAVSVPIVVMAVSKSFTAQEHVVRTDWEIDAGTVIDQSEEFQVDIAQAKLGDGCGPSSSSLRTSMKRASPTTTWTSSSVWTAPSRV